MSRASLYFSSLPSGSHFVRFTHSPPLCYLLKITNNGLREKKIFFIYGCFSVSRCIKGGVVSLDIKSLTLYRSNDVSMIFEFEIKIFIQQQDFQIRNQSFNLKTRFLKLKSSFYLKARFLNLTSRFLFKSKIFQFETETFVSKQDFCI